MSKFKNMRLIYPNDRAENLMERFGNFLELIILDKQVEIVYALYVCSDESYSTFFRFKKQKSEIYVKKHLKSCGLDTNIAKIGKLKVGLTVDSLIKTFVNTAMIQKEIPYVFYDKETMQEYRSILFDI